MIHEFNPVIYPCKLWISITKNLREVGEKFNEYPSLKNYDTYLEHRVNAYTDSVVEKSTNNFGILIVFRTKKDCTPSVITHESIHAAKRIWKYINERKPASESNAYLAEWIAHCIEKVKQAPFTKINP